MYTDHQWWTWWKWKQQKKETKRWEAATNATLGQQQNTTGIIYIKRQKKKNSH
jgi:hypothetical protein